MIGRMDKASMGISITQNGLILRRYLALESYIRTT